MSHWPVEPQRCVARGFWGCFPLLRRAAGGPPPLHRLHGWCCSACRPPLCAHRDCPPADSIQRAGAGEPQSGGARDLTVLSLTSIRGARQALPSEPLREERRPRTHCPEHPSVSALTALASPEQWDHASALSSDGRGAEAGMEPHAGTWVELPHPTPLARGPSARSQWGLTGSAAGSGCHARAGCPRTGSAPCPAPSPRSGPGPRLWDTGCCSG